jgi:hypothetical protein
MDMVGMMAGTKLTASTRAVGCAQIKNWITFNEPPMVCEGYNAPKFAPGVGGGRKYYYG